MTKFLRQTCLLERYLTDANGQPKLNTFGEIQYEAPQKVKCRHEMSHKDVQTTNGSTMRSTSVYYLDDSAEIKADYRINGEVIISAIGYTNAKGQTEGYEVYV